MKAVNLEKLLPADIPAGERILWHGRPQWISLARRAYRADFVSSYFVALAVWNFVSVAPDAGLGAAVTVVAKTLGLAAIALALIGLLAYASARTTLYVVTTRRLVFKIGVALPIFINLPFTQVMSAAARIHGDGTGDIPLSISPGRRIAYFALWPHARPLQYRNPQPTLRCVSNAASVAEALSCALKEAAGQRESALRPGTQSPEEPAIGMAALPEQAAA